MSCVVRYGRAQRGGDRDNNKPPRNEDWCSRSEVSARWIEGQGGQIDTALIHRSRTMRRTPPVLASRMPLLPNYCWNDISWNLGSHV